MNLMTFHHLSWMNWKKKYGQSIEVTSEGQARLRGSEKQEKERREKERPTVEMMGKVSREEHERQRAVSKQIERERRKEYEKEKREKEDRERKEANSHQGDQPQEGGVENLSTSEGSS